MLQMNGIRKVYRTDLVETHALEGLSVTVGDGEFVSIMGPSGSGKTTFLNIAGLLDVFVAEAAPIASTTRTSAASATGR